MSHVLTRKLVFTAGQHVIVCRHRHVLCPIWSVIPTAVMSCSRVCVSVCVSVCVCELKAHSLRRKPGSKWAVLWLPVSRIYFHLVCILYHTIPGPISCKSVQFICFIVMDGCLPSIQGLFSFFPHPTLSLSDPLSFMEGNSHTHIQKRYTHICRQMWTYTLRHKDKSIHALSGKHTHRKCENDQSYSRIQ